LATRNESNRVTDVYRSKCHSAERTVLEGQKFPRCGHCDSPSAWIFIRPTEPPKYWAAHKK